MKILHVLANSYPQVNGYAVRSQMILFSQSQIQEIECLAVTSPWYPYLDSMVEENTLHGIKYLRAPHPRQKENRTISHKIISLLTPKIIRESVNTNSSNKHLQGVKSSAFIRFFCGKLLYFPRIIWKVVEEKILIKYFTKRIVQISKENSVDIIHAHTPYRVGLPALNASRKLNLPFVYEMRGMWEETAVANGRWMRNGPAYRRFQRFETKVLQKADSVVCISETLKQEAISRGVDASKITVVTNAVQQNFAEQKSKGVEYDKTVELLNLKDSTKVIGYIGSLREMEGVDLSAEAVARLVSSGQDVRFLVLSSQSGQNELKQYCERLGLGDNAVIIGPVPHEEVVPFYEIIDIFVVSRPNTRVTQLVTPLKPFEAMLMGKAVIASRLPALQEIIQDEYTGLLFEPGNLESLVDIITRCLSDENLVSRLGKSASEWVVNNRTWDVVTKSYVDAYTIAKHHWRG